MGLLLLCFLSLGPLQAGPQQARPDLSSPLLLSDASHTTGTPRVGVGPEGNVYVAWGGGPLACTSNVYFALSTDGGQSFSPPVNLTGIPCEATAEGAYNAKLDVDAAGNLYLVWVRESPEGPPPNQVYFTRSTDGGLTFTTPKNISNSPPIVPSVGAIVPDIAAGGPGQVCAAWTDRYDQEQLDQVFFSCSTDQGETFSPPVQVSFRPSPDWSNSGRPAVAVKPGGLVLVGWSQTRVGAVDDVFLIRSLDFGGTFSAPLSLTEGFAPSSHQQLAVDAEERVYASWRARLSRSYETFFSRSLDDGATFLERRRITRNGHGPSLPMGLAVGRPGQVCVAWVEFAKGSDIFARCSFNSGERFRKAFNASGHLGWEQGDIAADAAGNVYVVFGGDLRSINPDAWWTGVYFRRSLNPLP